MAPVVRRELSEVLLGAAIIVIAVAFVAFAFRDTSGDAPAGYRVSLQVDNAFGLEPGSEARMAGIPVGRVARLDLDPKSYFARIVLDLDPGVELPTDSSARVLPDGLVGSSYVELEVGGELDILQHDDSILYTQGAVNIIDLLARVIMGPKVEPGGEEPADETQ